MGSAFPDMLVAKEVDTERAVEAVQRIKEKKRWMKWKEDEIKGGRLKHQLCVSLYISTYGSIHAKTAIGVTCYSVVSWLRLMNIGIEIGYGYNESVCVCVYICKREIHHPSSLELICWSPWATLPEGKQLEATLPAPQRQIYTVVNV